MNTVLTQVLKEFVSESWYFPQIRVVDAVEILIITFLFYQIILWIKNTKAWLLHCLFWWLQFLKCIRFCGLHRIHFRLWQPQS